MVYAGRVPVLRKPYPAEGEAMDCRVTAMITDSQRRSVLYENQLRHKEGFVSFRVLSWLALRETEASNLEDSQGHARVPGRMGTVLSQFQISSSFIL